MDRVKPVGDEDQSYVEQMIAHQGDLRAFIYSLIPNSPSVDDVLQNTNLVLWKKRKNFKEGTNFHAWAFKIARYQVQHQYDRIKRDQLLVFSDTLLDQMVEAASSMDSRSLHQAALEECVSKLSDQQREIVKARYTRGSSLEQLADQLQSSAGSLRIALHRIRAALRKCVEKSLAKELS